MDTFLFTSESVSDGHPDKIADQISDAVLDNALSQDPNSRVACEVLVNTGLVVVSGEMTTDCYIDIPNVVRDVVTDIGYVRAKYGFDAETCSVISTIDKQSPDIAMGVDTGGAGDQGLMFGYAVNETPELMPLPIMLSHKIMRTYRKFRNDPKYSQYLRPDGKCQVTIEYDSITNKPIRVHTVVLSYQHHPELKREEIESIGKTIIKEGLDHWYSDSIEKIYINPTGRFVIGGPMGDCGLTGRKIIVDTYGGRAPHGGGAFSGKDSTKVDRSAAYMSRYLAKNIVASGICHECLIQVAYAIGVKDPVSIFVKTENGRKFDQDLERAISQNFDLSVRGIIDYLKLRRPIYRETARFGHFGRNDVPWEIVDVKDIFSKIG
jgi:S-adenosylmethionine synthetase